jgi:uncharacterized protein (TIGR02001 family)
MNAFKLTALTLVMAASATAAQAADILTIPDVTVSGSVAATTDYLFRGVSQTGSDAAIQGSLMASHTSGVYAGVWASSVASGINKDGSEMDFSLGYTMPLALTPNLKSTLDVGYTRYAYAGSGADVDFNELYAKVGVADSLMKDDKFTLGLAYSDDYFNNSDQFVYVSGDYNAPITGTNFGVVTHVGFNSFDSKDQMTKALGFVGSDESYIDYKVGATFGVQGLSAELAYVGSDIDDKDCNGGSACEGRAVFSLSKAF